MLSLVALITFFSNVHGLPRGPELKQPPVVDFNATAGIARFVVRYQNVTIRDERNGNATVAAFTTRLYCLEGVGCTFPAATLRMYPSIPARMEMCNALQGLGRENLTDKYVRELGYTPYKDQDVVNVHTHGLHVNPSQDDIVNRFQKPFCPPGMNSTAGRGCIVPNANRTNYHCELYNYTLPYYHYPGSHWWHSHWHGAVTLQVAGGMYGAIDVQTPVNSPYKFTMPSSWFMVGYMYANTTVEPDCPCEARGDRSVGQPTIGNNVKGPRGRTGFAVITRCMLVCQYSVEETAATGMSYEMHVPNTTVEFYTVNGQYQPTKSLKTGQWHRFRVVVTTINYLFLQLSNYTACDAYLLGNDGIMFDNAANGGTGPRDMSQQPYWGSLALPIGSRADIAVRCRMPGRYEFWALNVEIARSVQQEGKWAGASFPLNPINASSRFSKQNHEALRRIGADSQDCQGGAGQIGTTFFAVPTATKDFMLADLEVTGPITYDTAPPDVTPPPYSSCMYLKDTLNLEAKDYTTRTSQPRMKGNTAMLTSNLVLPSRPLAINQSYVAMATGMNNVSYSEFTPLFDIQTPSVHEWTVYIRFHPFHHHTWPFQVYDSYPSFETAHQHSTGWFVRKGDWRDVVGLYGSLIIRVNYVAGGPQAQQILNNQLVTHCHFVFHEDWGMMEWINMTDKVIPPLSYSPNPLWTLKSKGKTQVGGGPQPCVKSSFMTQGGRVTVKSIVLNAEFHMEIASFGAEQLCHAVVFSGTSRPNVENFYVEYGLSTTNAFKCGNTSGIALRLQVFRDAKSGKRLYQTIPVAINTPNYPAPVEYLSVMNLECEAPMEVVNATTNSFSYNVTCFFKLPDITMANLTGFRGPVFASDSGVKSFTWTYGEGIGSSAFPQYANENVQSCNLRMTSVSGRNSSSLQVIDTVCEYGYFHLIRESLRFYTSQFPVAPYVPPTTVGGSNNGGGKKGLSSLGAGVLIGAGGMLGVVLIVGLVLYCCVFESKNERGGSYVQMNEN